MSFYTITKENGMFTATVRNRFTLFADENIKDLKQFGIALITTEIDGTHSLYIPTRVCGLTSSVSYIDCEIETIKALSGISSYQYFNDTLLLIKDNYCVFIQPNNYAWYFNRVGIAEGRRDKLEKIYFTEKAYIREDFDYLTNNNVICNVDGNDYLIRNDDKDSIGIYDTSSQIEIIPLGKAEPLSGNNNCIKVTNKNGMYIHHEGLPYEIDNQDKESIIYADRIVEFDINDSSAFSEIIYEEKKSYGYWFKNSDGNILKLELYPCNSLDSCYNVSLEKPAKSIKFVKCLTFYNDTQLVIADVWKVLYADGEEKILLKCNNDTLSIDLKELMSL